MAAADYWLEQAAAIHASSDELERSNTLLERQLDLVDKVAASMENLRGTPPLGAPNRPLIEGRDTAGPGGAGGRTVTYQGPNGQLQEILDANGKVVSIVPVGPQRLPAAEAFGSAAGGGGAAAAAGAPAAGGGGGSPQDGGVGFTPSSVAPGVLPAATGRGLTGTTGGGKTVVAAIEVLRQYCHATEYTIPDPTVPNASPIKGPWIRRTVWTCPQVPLVLPEGGTFTQDEKVAGGIGAGFIGAAPTSQSSSTGPGGGAPGPGNVSGGSSLGRPAGSFAPPTSPTVSTSAPSSTGPTGPTPGERLLAGVARDLGKAIDKLAVKIGTTDGGLSLRTKGLTL